VGFGAPVLPLGAGPGSPGPAPTYGGSQLAVCVTTPL
jgi:hypothetical protein